MSPPAQVKTVRAQLNLGIHPVKKLVVLFGLFTAALPGFVCADPNIYGPGGVNLGPDGELPPSDEELKKDRLVEEQREHIRSLEEQVQQLQHQVEQLLQIQQDMQWRGQNPVEIEINTGYPPQQNYGWFWGGPFWGGSSGGITLESNPRARGGGHPGAGGGGGGGGRHGGGGHGRR